MNIRCWSSDISEIIPSLAALVVLYREARLQSPEPHHMDTAACDLAHLKDISMSQSCEQLLVTMLHRLCLLSHLSVL